jgi:hypothetical protein
MQIMTGDQGEKLVDVTAENAVSEVEEKLEDKDGYPDRNNNEQTGKKRFSEMSYYGFQGSLLVNW